MPCGIYSTLLPCTHPTSIVEVKIGGTVVHRAADKYEFQFDTSVSRYHWFTTIPALDMEGVLKRSHDRDWVLEWRRQVYVAEENAEYNDWHQHEIRNGKLEAKPTLVMGCPLREAQAVLAQRFIDFAQNTEVTFTVSRNQVSHNFRLYSGYMYSDLLTTYLFLWCDPMLPK